VERLNGNPSEVWAVAFTADGRGIISGAKDGTVRLWPTNAAPKEKRYEGNWMPVKFSKDGQVLAAIEDQSKLVLLNLRTGEPNDQLQLSQSQWGQWAGTISADFRVFVDSLPKGGLRVWDLPSKKSVDLESQDIQKSWTVISPDGTALLAGAKGDSVLWWNLQDPSEAPARIEGKRALFARSANVLVTLHDHSIKAWSVKPRSLKADFPVEADLGFTAPMVLSDDGTLLAIGSNPVTEADNAIRLWDTHTGKLLGVCKGHTQGVRWLAFSPDGQTLASASSDSTLRLWDLRTQQELLSIQRLADPMSDILFSPDGNWLAGKTASGLHLLDGSADREAAKTMPSQRSPAGQ
jgi:WD40 repeat protein